MKQTLTGTGVALLTPFDQQMQLDEAALRQLVNFVTEGGVDYLVALGTTAETATLRPEEKQRVLNVILDENAGKLPVVVGIGGNNTAVVGEEISRKLPEEVVAILSVSPYYNRPTQEGIYRHYRHLDTKTHLPVLIYNVPSRTGSNISAGTVIRISEDCPNIKGIKEASGSLEQIAQIINGTHEDFLVVSGDDMTAWETVKIGGDGVISVLGQGVPKSFTKMIRAALNADFNSAMQGHQRLEPLMDLIFEEGNPAGIKALLKLQGIGDSDVRLPLVKASDGLVHKLHDALKSLHQIPA